MTVISYRCFDRSWFCSTLLSTFGIPVLALSLNGCQTMQAASSGNTSNLVQAASTDLQMHVAAEVQHRNKPRPASVQYAGELVPVQSIDSAIRGNTIIVQTPWVQEGRHISTKEEPIFFSDNGMAFSRTWGERPWSVRGSEICITSQDSNRCMTALSDSSGQAYLKDHYSFLLAKVSLISSGDSMDVVQSYRDHIERKMATDMAMLGIIGSLFIKAMQSQPAADGYDSSLRRAEHLEYDRIQRGGKSWSD